MSNTITAYFKGRVGVAESVYQNDYGIVMEFDSIVLPTHFDCYFSKLNQEEAVPAIGADNRVVIPNSILADPGNMTIHIPLHTGESDSEVEYVIYFKVIGRARPIDDGTPAQMTAIERALALLSQPITNIEEIVNEALSFTGDTFDEMQAKLDADQAEFEDAMQTKQTEFESGINSDFEQLNSQFNNLATNVKANSVKTLWTGTLKAKNDSATLSESVANFDYIDIYTGSTDNRCVRKKVSDLSSVVKIQGQNLYDMSGSYGLAESEIHLSISGTTATIVKTINFSWNGEADQAADSSADAYDVECPIIRIDGVKIGSHESAELTDIRVGADGITDTTAGASVRRQFSDLKSDISDINNILGNTLGTKTKSGSQIEITDAVVGDSITSISGSGLINNGNILPSSLLSKTYTNPDATTESITSNKWGFALVSASDLNSILKAGKKYTLSYDFELVEVKNATIANKEYGLMMSGGAIIPPYNSTAENHHDGFKFSVSQEFTVPSGGFTASLNFYNGGNYNDDICTLTNMVISCEGVTVAWREANNVVLGDESTVTIPYNPMYIDSDDDTVSVEYMGKSTTNRLDEMESVSSGIIAEMSEMKIATNPHIKNVCHRGLASVAPEDTAPAYVAAKIAGFEYVENDLWFTSDGVPVMVHARDLSLVSDGTGNIDEVTYSYFKSLDFGQATVYGDKYTGLEGLSFEEFVILCKTLGLYMYLDCKSFSPYPEGYNNGIEVCLEILEKHSFTKNVTWIVGLSGVASVRNLIPDARVAYIISNTPDASDIEDLSSYILADDPDATLFDVNDSYITTQSVIDVHNAGLKIEAWRSEIPPTESAILETALKGIDGYTNDGANLNKIITDYYKDLYGID